MAISFRKYVDITSGVGGAAQVPQRELIARIFSGNELIPTKSFGEFTDVESVGGYFGTQSEEYARAQFYLGFISKLTTRPKKISFARWASADTAPQVFGESMDQNLSAWQAISNGAIAITLGPDTEIITGIDFSTDLSLADVAATLQAAVQAANVAALFSAATVTYDAVAKRFNMTGGATGNAVISIALAGSGTEIATMLGWLNPDTILSNGVVAESVTDVLAESAGASDNFGSFSFMPALTIDQVEEAAQWAKTENVKYQFHHSVLEIDAQAYYDQMKNIAGYGQTIRSASISDEYPEMAPMAILAATDYTRRNANQNYMYQQFDLTPTVNDTLTSNALDDIRTNYYGVTQRAGANLEFYQRGLLMGLASDPKDMNTFANEQWLKDSAAVAIMNLLLASSAVSGDRQGETSVTAALMPTIEQAKFNGVISIGKTLNQTQKEYILSVTGDEHAAQQINAIGYWLNVTIRESATTPGEFEAVYLLLYAKADAVRKVSGTHTLI